MTILTGYAICLLLRLRDNIDEVLFTVEVTGLNIYEAYRKRYVIVNTNTTVLQSIQKHRE